MARCIKCGADCCACSGCVLNEGKWCNNCYTQIVKERNELENKKQDEPVNKDAST